MTKKEKQKYIKDPTVCPKCGSINICSDPVEADGGYAWSNVECLDCEAVWKDAWEVVDVEMVK